ncbi:hypothetical protein J2Z22_001982 [Paenibacillus forsythiae]|uniref:DUF4177 domain-containing protein n=1 Tax=Paenibacillus forsythiae TaxID=365616 RepID=A0ABU3H6V4_9BACL|nr:hypothetical protein [Paenibacillus forsythiae]MDT3426456.1 hypothetical protein [Paenibacillus forsythiae]
MKKLEYRCVNIVGEFKHLFKSDKGELNQKVEDSLNDLGRDGWELVAVEGTWFYLKREI